MEETNPYNKRLQPLTVQRKSQKDKYLKQDGVRLDHTFHIHGFMELETTSALRFPRKRESTMWSLGLRAVAVSSHRRRVKPSEVHSTNKREGYVLAKGGGKTANVDRKGMTFVWPSRVQHLL